MATEMMRGFNYVARRLWCGFVGHNFTMDKDTDHVYCLRCNKNCGCLGSWMSRKQKVDPHCAPKEAP